MLKMVAFQSIRHGISLQSVNIVCIFIIVLITAYHRLWHTISGVGECGNLLEDGRMEEKAWQPTGCMLHNYTHRSAQQCLLFRSQWVSQPYIAFVGDSRIAHMQRDLASLLTDTPLPPPEKHADMYFKLPSSNSHVVFLWHPFIDGGMYGVYKEWLSKKKSEWPDVVVTGAATWCIKEYNGSQEAFRNYKVNLTNLVPFLREMSPRTRIIWMLQEPVVESRLHPVRTMITNKQLDMYNQAAIDIFRGSPVVLWRSGQSIAEALSASCDDGLHHGNDTLTWQNEVLLNYYCNRFLYPKTGSCCVAQEELSVVQKIAALVFTLSFLVWVYLYWTDDKDSPSEEHSFLHLFSAVVKLGLILTYFFLADWANMYMKENKHFSFAQFGVALLVLLLIGCYFSTNVQQVGLLQREQSLEWKGWMQLVILVYHISGASKVLPIYLHIRVLVSSYLFMTGFGHFCYFYLKGNFSIHRLCQILFRMNLLVICLCVVMNRSYQFYYFVPLVSFWFVVVYLVMGLGPQVTSEEAEESCLPYVVLVVKFGVLILVISLLNTSERVFEKVFYLPFLRGLFLTSDQSMHEWRFRWQLDRLSVLYGMVFGFLLLSVPSSRLQKAVIARCLSICVPVFALLGLVVYEVFVFTCARKEECNLIHSYITILPIFAYIILRNIPRLQTRYSYFFSWIGGISLELFIGQYHIWLAQDTQGVLVLIPGFPLLNLLITTPLFIWLAYHIHLITLTILPYAVPADTPALIRNVLIFTALLMPLLLTRGYLGL